MVHEKGIPDFDLWLIPALQWFAIISASLAGIGVIGGFLVSVLQHGPTEGFYRTAKVIFSAFTSDLPGFSLRRTLAIAWLVIQESIRKRVLIVVVAVFAVILVFAGWFIDSRSDNPTLVYLSFVLGISNLLVMVMSIFLSTLSLPNDIKSRTIYTIVTKPVRASEIVLGRILGFMGVGTLLLVVMGLLSYIFVTRGLNHSHTLKPDSLTEIRSQDESRKLLGHKGETTLESGHRHSFEIPLGKVGLTTQQHGHTHEVTLNDDKTITVGPPLGLLDARVPIYGKLSWQDRRGRETDKGINVGNEWEYRHYVAGGTAAKAIYRFKGITRERFPNGIPLEFTVSVFRTYKGDIEKPVLGSITIRNPNTAVNKQSKKLLHRFKEYQNDSRLIELEIDRQPDAEDVATAGREQKVIGKYDLFDDLVDNGEIEVLIQCEEAGQYYGVAQADVYIRANDGSFVVNFIKCLFSIWLQMMIVVCFGVLFSTFLSGPVAFLGSISTIVIGYFMDFIREIVEGIYNPNLATGYKGGGPVESIIRIMTQQNLQTELEVGPQTNTVVKTIDTGFATMIYACTFVVPDFTLFDTVPFVAYGFNIDSAEISILLLKGLAYAFGATIIAYFIFKTREVAA